MISWNAVVVAVARPDRLVERRRRLRRRAGAVVRPVAEAEAVQPAVPRLEEGDDRGEVVRAADAVADVVAPSRVRPGGVALLVAGGELDHLGAPLRPAARAAADRLRKPDLVESHDGELLRDRGGRARRRGRCRRRPACATGGSSRRRGVMIVTLTARRAPARRGRSPAPRAARAPARRAAGSPGPRPARARPSRRRAAAARRRRPRRARAMRPGRSDDAALVQHAGEQTAGAAERARQRVGDGAEDEAPRRQLRQIGDHRA